MIFFRLLLILGAVALTTPGLLGQAPPWASSDDYMTDLETEFNKRVGRLDDQGTEDPNDDVKDEDYIHFINDNRTAPEGAKRTWHVSLLPNHPTNSTAVGSTKGGQTNVYYKPLIGRGCPGPLELVPGATALEAILSTLWHEWHHFPDINADPPDGPGPPAGKGDVGEKENGKWTCDHLQLHIDQFNRDCARISEIVGQSGDNCQTIQLLCFNLLAKMRHINGKYANTDTTQRCPSFTLGPEGRLVDPCQCCIDFGLSHVCPVIIVVIGPEDPFDINYQAPGPLGF